MDYMVTLLVQSLIHIANTHEFLHNSLLSIAAKLWKEG